MSITTRYPISKPALRATVGVAVFLSLGAIPGARADNAKLVSGSVCENMYPPNSSYGSDLYHEAEGVRNGSKTDARFVVCPILRDDTLNFDGLADLEVVVSDPTGTLYCYASSIDRWGNVFASKTKTTPFPGDAVINFGSVINSSATKGTYQLTCVMPPGSRIRSLYSDED